MKRLIISLISQYNSYATLLQPISILTLRLYIANIFWKSGLTKIESWQKTLWLFENEYSVPLLSPNLAAICSIMIELACPIMLVVGLGTRFAALAMFGMTMVINFTYQQDIEHYYWLMILSVLVCYGASKLSIDAMIKARYSQSTD